MTRRKTRTRSRLLVVAALFMAASASLPIATATADGPLPSSTGSGGVGSYLGTPDLLAQIGTATTKACTPKGTAEPTDAWAGLLGYRVGNDTLRATIQFIWNTYDSDYQASAIGMVPDTGCAKMVRVRTQITDTTSAPFCQKVVQSKDFVAYGADQTTDVDGRKVLEVDNPNVFELPVLYFGVDSTLAAPTSSDPGSDTGQLSVPDTTRAGYCARTSSLVQVRTITEYENNLNQYVAWACALDDYSISATPNQPIINYLDTVDCS